VFAPINDLFLSSRSGTADRSSIAGQKKDVEMAGGQLVGDEYSDHVVKVRILTKKKAPEFNLCILTES